jgi:hypothetical protein
MPRTYGIVARCCRLGPRKYKFVPGIHTLVVQKNRSPSVPEIACIYRE